MTREDLDLMWTFAERICKAKFIPDNLRGDVASAFYQIATAEGLGLEWTHAIRSTFPSREGGLGMKGDVMLALLQRAGVPVKFDFTTEPIGCTCTITRPDRDPVSRTFTMEDASRIQTRWQPDDSERGGHWLFLSDSWFYRNHGPTMCQWRSLAHCARVAAADICGGLYLPEELEEPQKFPEGTPASPSSPEEFVVGEKPEPPAEDKAPWVEPTATEGTQAPTETTDPVTETSSTTAVTFVLGPKTLPADPTPAPTPEPPTPAPAAAVVNPFEDAIAKIDAAVGGDTDATHKLIGRYFKTFLGVKYIPKDRTKLMPALEKLAEVIDARVGDLRADPESLGALLSGREKGALEVEFDRLGWPAETRELAKAFMVQAKQSDTQFLSYLKFPMAGETENGPATVALADLEPAALEIFFRIFSLVRGRAWEVVDMAVVNKEPITATLQTIITASGKPLKDWDAPFCAAILDRLTEMGKTPEPAKPADDADPFSGGLPFEN